MRRDASLAAMQRARSVLAGGVSSPVRAFRAVGGTPLVIRSGRGAMIEDADGNELVDFVQSWGPLIAGHAHPLVVERLRAATLRGTTFGAPSETETELAGRVVGAYPGLERLRFVSSGTEAVMSAVRVARGATGRDLVVKFDGCYHGHADHLLVAAGSGLATFGESEGRSTASSAGVPDAFASLTRVLPLDDEGAFEALMQREGERVAAVLIEPLPANHGLLPQRPAFLEALRAGTRHHGALLIFDEVISGFRVAPGGMAGRTGITPDLACFGKVIGGGLPVGAFGGREEILRVLAPEGPVYQAGTLSGNPLAMTAGLATLDILEHEGGREALDAAGRALETAVGPVLEGSPVPARLVREGSLFWFSLQPGPPPRRADAIMPSVVAAYRGLHASCLEDGVYLAPSAFEVGFLACVHGEEHVERLAGALARGLGRLAGASS